MVSVRLLLIGGISATLKFATAQSLSCDDLLININNETDTSFYSTCPVIAGNVGPSHTFSGPFNLPNVQSIAQFSAGYLGPKLRGTTRVEDLVTTVSMPDLLNVTSGSLFLGYLNNLTSIDFPKLETISRDLVLTDNYELTSLSLPALSNVTGGGLLDGHFDSISLPALKTISYLVVKSTGDLDCIALGKNLSSLIFNPDPEKYNIGVGFTCWTPDKKNRYNSSEVGSNSGGGATPTGSAPAGTSSAASEAGNMVRVRCVSAMMGLAAVAGFVGLLL